MQGVHFDWTINPAGILTAIGVVIAIGRVVLSLRDAMRDLVRQVGTVDDSKYLRSGILGEMANMQEEIEKLRAIATDHREWLLLNGFDRRRTGRDRRDIRPPNTSD